MLLLRARASQHLSRPSSASRRSARSQWIPFASSTGQQPQQSEAGQTAGSVTEQPGSANQRRQQQEQLQQEWFEQSSVYYSNYPLNRAAERRTDEAQLSQWFNAPNTRVTPVLGPKVLLLPNSTSSTPAKFHPVWVSPAADLGAALNPSVPPLFLGLDPSGAAHFAVQVSKEAAEQLAASHEASWVSARVAGPDLTRQDAALMAVASGLAQWNLDTQYHGASGANTLPQVGVVWGVGVWVFGQTPWPDIQMD